jgi:PAH dioxygenase small subunit
MSIELHHQVSSFLTKEAELLDAGELDTWLTLLDPEIRYFMPVRSVRYGSSSSEFSQSSYHYNENFFTLSKRVERLHSKFAWAEDPPSHYRHFVSNVSVADTQEDLIKVTSSVLLYRGRAPEVGGELLTGTRKDELRRGESGFRLLSRWFYVDQTVLPVPALTTFI